MKKLLFLLLVFIAPNSFSQTLSRENTLEVVTWNLEWFGNEQRGPEDEALQLQNALVVIDKMGKPDVIVFEEITTRAHFEELANQADYHFYLSPGADAYQKIGIFYSNEVLLVDSSKQILVDEKHQFAQRPPVLTKFNHAAVGDFNVIGFHLKAHIPRATTEDKQDSYDRRKLSAQLISRYIRDSLNNDQVIVLGDWNDDIDVSNYDGKETPFKTLLEDQTVDFITKYLSFSLNKSSKYGSVIDHILISNELFNDYEGCGIFNTMDLGLDYIESTSDHYPVFSIFR
jgi:exonuclease III